MSLATWTVDSPINLYLPQNPEASDPQLNGELSKVYNAMRNLQIAITQYAGVGQREQSTWNQLSPLDTVQVQNLARVYALAAEGIPLGALVSCFDGGGGTLYLRRANATSGTIFPAHGFCTTLGGILPGAYGEIQLLGVSPYITGMAIGQTYYLATSPGLITNVRPSSPNLGQTVGYAIGGNVLMFNPILP